MKGTSNIVLAHCILSNIAYCTNIQLTKAFTDCSRNLYSVSACCILVGKCFLGYSCYQVCFITLGQEPLDNEDLPDEFFDDEIEEGKCQ